MISLWTSVISGLCTNRRKFGELSSTVIQTKKWLHWTVERASPVVLEAAAAVDGPGKGPS